MKITVALNDKQSAALLRFLREHGQDVVREVLSPEEAKAFEMASDRLRISLHVTLESE
jgi:hypothetical protein